MVFSSDRDGDAEIFVMEVPGSEVRQLTRNETQEWDLASSPDGTWFAYVSDRDGNPEIYVVRADGTAETRVTDHQGLDINPSWSPDGTQIVFLSSGGGRTGAPPYEQCWGRCGAPHVLRF